MATRKETRRAEAQKLRRQLFREIDNFNCLSRQVDESTEIVLISCLQETLRKLRSNLELGK